MWNVATYVSHKWQVVDATTGGVMRTYVANKGDQMIVIEPQDEEMERFYEPRQAAQGFDGIGGREEDYIEAKVTEVAISDEGGVVYISPAPVAAALQGGGTIQELTSKESMAARKAASIPIYIAQAEANAMIHAAGMETRRPMTVRTWMDTLAAADAKVDRVLITRLADHIFYSRIHLALPYGKVQTVDARPSDALALALQTHSPIYLARTILTDPNSRTQRPFSGLDEMDSDEMDDLLA